VNWSGSAAGPGLLSAASWGGSDFIGGLGARRAPVFLIVVSGHFVTLLALLAISLGGRFPLPGRHDLLFSAAGGFEGALALAMFYRALAMGAMGLTAALTGLLTAMIPVLFSLLEDGPPSSAGALGLAMGLAAVWLITYAPGAHAATGNAHCRPPRTPPRALLLGTLAGLGFGAQLVLFKFAAGGGILWVMTSARAAGVTAMLLVILFSPPARPWQGFWLYGTLAGAFDTAGNLLYIEATRFGRLDLAAVICSLYPAGTILLAALVFRERPTGRQFVGMALALTAVVLLSVQ
jgi:drug/metabolite transporter (DMT)-like permease